MKIMKRLLIICIATLLAYSSAYGWGRREHAVVAKIAENHLTAEAKQMLHEYMHRRSLVYYAHYADDYQPILIDLGWKPSNDEQKVPFPHSFSVDKDFKPYRDVRKGDKYVKNCIYFIDKWAKELKTDHATMNDSVRMMHIALIVHAVGDMHSPVRIRYPHDNTLCRYKVKYGKKSRSLFELWDSGFLASTHSIQSYTDFARFIDIRTEEQIAGVCRGDVWSWGEEVARDAVAMRNYKPDEEIDPVKFKRDNLDRGEDLLRNAGYRLAKILNEIFVR